MVGIIKTCEGILFYTRKPWEKKIYIRMKRIDSSSTLIYCNNDEELERVRKSLVAKGYRVEIVKRPKSCESNSSPVKIKDVLHFATGYLVVIGYVWDGDFMSLSKDNFMVIPEEDNRQLILR